MSASGELKLEEVTYFDFVTHHPSTAAITDADSGPTAEVFEDATDTTVVALTVTKRTSKTGNYRCPVTAAAADGFEVGKTYNVVASATVNSIAGKGVIGRFKVRARGKDDLAFPATSGRSLDVDSSGRTLLQPTQTGVTIPTVTTYTGNTPQTGDSFARIGANGAGLTAVVAASVTGAVGSVTAGVTLAASAVQAIWDALTSALTTVGSLGKLLVDNVNATISSRLASASYTTPPTVGAIADQVWDEAAAGHVAAGSTGAALGAAGAAGDPWSTAIPGSYTSGQAGKVVGDALDAAITSRGSAITLAQVLAMLDDARAEPGQGAPPANADLATKVDYLYKFLRNRITQDSTTLRVYADNGTTIDHKAPVSDAAGVYDRGEIISGP